MIFIVENDELDMIPSLKVAPSPISKPPVNPGYKKVQNSSKKSIKSNKKHEFSCIPLHQLKIADNSINEQATDIVESSNADTNQLGYNFDELDYHESVNTAQEKYALKQKKYKVTPRFKDKFNQIKEKYDHVEKLEDEKYSVFDT